MVQMKRRSKLEQMESKKKKRVERGGKETSERKEEQFVRGGKEKEENTRKNYIKQTFLCSS